MPVNSELFHDACPGTHKYLEIHYACLSSSSPLGSPANGRKAPALPPWMFELQEASPTSNSKVNTALVQNNNKDHVGGDGEISPGSQSAAQKTENNSNVRKPILVTEKVEVERRVPITTPRPTTPSTTMTTTTTTVVTTTEVTTRVPLNKSQKVLQKAYQAAKATTTLAVSSQGRQKVFQYLLFGLFLNLYGLVKLKPYWIKEKHLRLWRKKVGHTRYPYIVPVFVTFAATLTPTL